MESSSAMDKSATFQNRFILGGTIMTKCEQIQNQINKFKELALKTNGVMSQIWNNHAEQLKLKLKNMSVKELSEEV